MTYGLTPIKFVDRRFKIFGFDIETYDNNKGFLMASLDGEDYKKTFFSRRELIDELKTKRFKCAYIVATNLTFDFMGTFFKEPELQKFKTLFRGSELILAETYVQNKDFTPRYTSTKRHKIYFIDTMNFARLSVEKAGKIIGLPKLETPECIGKMPKTPEEWDEMITYNLRDSEVSRKFIEFLFDAFKELGCTPRKTIASTAMCLFKTKYLKETYFIHKTDVLKEQFCGYYGGRTEAFCRGMIEGYNYYDINSQYPKSMLNDFPHPNHLRTTRLNTLEHIKSFEGMSDVSIGCGMRMYPFLPVRMPTKLLFPVGNWRGWYSHVELRKALEEGYIITKVHKTHYYTKTCRPFDGYVKDLYEARLRYKAQGSPMEYVVKILLNSLYGKFGQKFIDRDNYIPAEAMTYEELQEYDFVDRIGDFFRVKKSESKPAGFCFPIWAAYITSYARIMLYDAIKACKPIYVDTDSLITKETLPTGEELGKLKLELRVKEGIIIRPKFYGLVDENDEEHVKIKGLGAKLSFLELLGMTVSKEYRYKKFMKFKEALRRHYTPNEIVEITKEFSMEDEKRVWEKPAFEPTGFQMSRPIRLVDGITEDEVDGEMWEHERHGDRNIYYAVTKGDF